MPASAYPSAQQVLRAAATIAWYALAFGALFVVAMLVSALGTIDNGYLLILTRLTALFAILGALYGAIIAFDPTAPKVLAPWSWIQQTKAPRARTLTCAALGAMAVWIGSLFATPAISQVWLLLGAAVGALLGWQGWRWAKYIDF